MPASSLNVYKNVDVNNFNLKSNALKSPFR